VQHGNFSFLCKGKCAFAWWITANVPSLRKKQQIVYLTSLTLLLTRAGVTAQSTLLHDISLYFENRKLPDFIVCDPPDHGRIETRKIWITTELNSYLNFPHVGQAFAIERESIEKKTGKYSIDVAYGITSRTPEQANAQHVLETNSMLFLYGHSKYLI